VRAQMNAANKIFGRNKNNQMTVNREKKELD
jgi:hypothetical protein